MSQPQACLATVDWGTSSFRLWLMNDEGHVIAERKSGEGIAFVPAHDFARALGAHLQAAGAPPSLPVIMCGMIGARQGWREAPYRDLPARLADLPEGAILPDPSQPQIRILPGLAKCDPACPDVMRGEETQLLGFCLDTPTPSGLFCLPGTHSKFVTLDNGRVTDFSTMMTGEIYSLLTQQSVLRHLPGSGDETGTWSAGPCFRAGIEQALQAPDRVLSLLFGLRARSLLFPEDLDDPRAFLSGLLIGAEIASMPPRPPQTTITLIGNDVLLPLYETGFALAGYLTRAIDGGDAARRGLLFAAKCLWPNLLRDIPR